MRILSSFFLVLWLVFAAPALAAQGSIVCHYTYGGETKLLSAQDVESPYAVPAIEVGSFFLFRVVVQARPADIASVKVYTYAGRDDGPVLIHQATYPYPLVHSVAQSAYGFTGLQYVYETTRDGELQYWCELPAVKSGKKNARRGQ